MDFHYKTLLDMVPCDPSPNYSSFNWNITMTNFVKKCNDQANEEDEFLIYKRDVITNNPLKIPARTALCTHIECIELEILFLHILETMSCPMCMNMNLNMNITALPKGRARDQNSHLSVDMIYIDNRFKGYLETQFNEKNDYIILNKHSLVIRKYNPEAGFTEDDTLDRYSHMTDFYRELNEINEFISAYPIGFDEMTEGILEELARAGIK